MLSYYQYDLQTVQDMGEMIIYAVLEKQSAMATCEKFHRAKHNETEYDNSKVDSYISYSRDSQLFGGNIYPQNLAL